MAAEARELRVLLSAKALAALDAIWDWNAERYSVEHAGISPSCAAEHRSFRPAMARGRPVPDRSNLRYMVLRPRRRKGHGHIAVYEVIGDAVYVLDYFHTAQDWQDRLG